MEELNGGVEMTAFSVFLSKVAHAFKRPVKSQGSSECMIDIGSNLPRDLRSSY